MAEPEVTEEQAQEALQQLLPSNDYESERPPQEIAAPEPSVVEPEPAQEAAEPEVAEDDLESLKTRYDEQVEKNKSDREASEARAQASQSRYEQNERALRDRLLRKSTVTDRALKTLQTAQSAEGVSEADVQRVIAEIQGTMNPASASYAAPTQATTTDAQEDQSLILNSFLNEKRMTYEEADEFGQWMQREGPTALTQSEQDVAAHSIDGFLRIAHPRWEGMKDQKNDEKRSDAVEAVKSVKRTQRQAAKAASGVTTAPRKQPSGTSVVNEAELTPDDISRLVRQSTTQYN